MKHQEKFDISQVFPWKIVVVTTSHPDYEMNRVMLIDNEPEASPDAREWILVRGYHCSCFKFDETEWDATWYTKAELLKVMEGWVHSDRQSERLAVAPIVLYLHEIEDSQYYDPRWINPVRKYGFWTKWSDEMEAWKVNLFPKLPKEGTNE